MKKARGTALTKEELKEVIEDKPVRELREINKHLWELRQMVAVIGDFVTRPEKETRGG